MANGIGYDLIVKDDNCESIANEYYKLGNRFEEYVNRYSEILNRVANDGIKSGKVHDNLLKFIEAVNGLKNQGKELTINAEKCANEFLQDMDTADSYLY